MITRFSRPRRTAVLAWAVTVAVVLCCRLPAEVPVTRYWWVDDGKTPRDSMLDRAWWVWNNRDMLADPDKKASYIFSRTIELPAGLTNALFRISAQGAYRLSVNGTEAGSDDDATTLEQYDLSSLLKPGANRFEIRVTPDTWYCGLFVCARFGRAAQPPIELISDRNWDIVRADDDWNPMGAPKSAAEVVRGVNGGFWNNCGRMVVMPEAWYRLNLGIETPGIAWAKPYAGRPLNILAIHALASQRDTVELVQRSDFDIETVFSSATVFGPQRRHAPFFPYTKGMRPEDVEAALRVALSVPRDAIIFGGLSFGGDRELANDAVRSAMYGDDGIADRLRQHVTRGGGLIYLRFPANGTVTVTNKQGKTREVNDTTFEDEMLSSPVEPAPSFVTEGTPFESLPVFHTDATRGVTNCDRVARFYTYGKGRIVRLEPRFIGGQSGLFANSSADRNDLHYQYQMAFAIKCMLWAAGAEPATRFTRFPESLAVNRAAPGMLSFTLESVPGDCEVACAIRCPTPGMTTPSAPLAAQGQERARPLLEPVWSATQPVAVGKTASVNVPLPRLQAGRYFVDVMVQRANAQLNWAVASLTVTSSIEVAGIDCDKEFIDVSGGRSDSLGATVRLTAPAPSDTQLALSVLDNYNRVVRRDSVPVTPGATNAHAQWRFDDFATTLGRVHADLLVNGESPAAGTARFTALRRDWDRFTFLSWWGGGQGHQRNVFDRLLVGKIGLDAARSGRLTMDWLEGADMVACPAYPAFPRYGAEEVSHDEILEKYKQRARDASSNQLRYDPLAFNTGDEFTYRGGEEQPARVARYRRELSARYRTIEALNAQWDSAYASFDEVYPLSRLSAQALEKYGGGDFVNQAAYLETARESLNYSRYIDQWLDNISAFNETAQVCLDAIKEVNPYARVGCDCPMWPHAASGHDWYRFMQDFDYFAPYGRGGEVIPLKEARSFRRPDQFIGLTYGGYLYMAFNRKTELMDVPWQHWRVWNGLFQGFSSLWWYTLHNGGAEANLGGGFEPYPTLRQVADDVDRIRRGVYTLLHELHRDYGPVAVYDSLSSRIVVGVMPDDFSAGNYGHNMNMHVLMHLLETVTGYPYTLVDSRQLPQGILAKYGVLMMPLTVAVGDAEADALEAFLRRGGIAIADVRPGILDGSGKWDSTQRVPGLFGLRYDKSLGRKTVSGPVHGTFLGEDVHIEPRRAFPVDPACRLDGADAVCTVDGAPVITVNRVGKGLAVCLNTPSTFYRGMTTPDCLYAYWGDEDHNALVADIISALFEALEVSRPVVTETEAPYDTLFGLEPALFRDGAARYVGLTKRREYDGEPTHRVTVHSDRPGHVYDAFTGNYLGMTNAWPVAVSNVDVRLYSVLPYAVKGLAVSVPDSVRQGDVLRGTIAVEKGPGGPPVRHVFNIDAFRPDGRRAHYLRRNVTASPGILGRLVRAAPSAPFELPIALNEMEGTWTLRITDVATQTSTEVHVAVE